MDISSRKVCVVWVSASIHAKTMNAGKSVRIREYAAPFEIMKRPCSMPFQIARRKWSKYLGIREVQRNRSTANSASLTSGTATKVLFYRCAYRRRGEDKDREYAGLCCGGDLGTDQELQREMS